MAFGQEILPLIQICVLPLIALFVWRLRIDQYRVPRTLIILALAISIAAFSTGYMVKPLVETRIVVSKFADDPLGSESRIFRERIDRYLADISSLQVVRFPSAFKSYKEVRAKFPHSRTLDAVLWGNKDIFYVVFPQQLQSLIAPGEKSSRALMGLKLSRQIPLVVLSRSSDFASVQFLADIFAAVFVDHMNVADALARREILLLDALHIQGLWRSRSHRAVAAWMLGQQKLEQSLEHDFFQSSELECALKRFANASHMFMATKDPELASAIYNSWGVALTIKGWHNADRSALQEAEKHFLKAISMQSIGHPRQATKKTVQIAKENLALLRGKHRVREGAHDAAHRDLKMNGANKGRVKEDGEKKEKRAKKKQHQAG